MNFNKLVARAMMASATALAVPFAAMAQDQSTMGGPEGAAMANAAAPADNAVAEPANPQVVAFVDYQFPSADADSNGVLSGNEFTTWISGLKSAELEKAGQAPDPAAVRTYADNALFTADGDKNKILTKDELVNFFGG